MASKMNHSTKRSKKQTPTGIRLNFDIESLKLELPLGVIFEHDVWDVSGWTTQVTQKFSLNFSRIENPQLREFTKALILRSRADRKSSPNTLYRSVRAAEAISLQLGLRPLSEISNADLLAAAENLGTKNKYRIGIKPIASALRHHAGIALFYNPSDVYDITHGTKGTDEGRSRKLISNEVIFQILLLNNKSLSTLDRLCIAIVALNLACGWRLEELLSLRHDCFLKDEGAVYITGNSNKGGNPVSKRITPALVPLVLQAYETILEITSPGRLAVRNWAASSDPDWQSVTRDQNAFKYYSHKIVSDWTSDPYSISIKSTKSGPVKNAESRESIPLPTLSINSIFNRMEYSRLDHLSSLLLDIIKSGRSCASSGTALPHPMTDQNLESRFARDRPAHSRDKLGNIKLYADEALFVVRKDWLDKNQGQFDKFYLINRSTFTHWLSGTGSTPSVFERHDIMDPQTGQAAKFTSHDIRHWIETQLHKGGLTDAQINTISGRRDNRSGSVYNQMSNSDRRALVR